MLESSVGSAVYGLPEKRHKWVKHTLIGSIGVRGYGTTRYSTKDITHTQLNVCLRLFYFLHHLSTNIWGYMVLYIQSSSTSSSSNQGYLFKPVVSSTALLKGWLLSNAISYASIKILEVKSRVSSPSWLRHYGVLRWQKMISPSNWPFFENHCLWTTIQASVVSFKRQN